MNLFGGSAAELQQWSVCVSSKGQGNTSVRAAEHRLEMGGGGGGVDGAMVFNCLAYWIIQTRLMKSFMYLFIRNIASKVVVAWFEEKAVKKVWKPHTGKICV